MLAMVMATVFLLAVAKEPLIGLTNSKAGSIPTFHKALYVSWGLPMIGGVLVAASIVILRGVPEDNCWLLVEPGPLLGAASLVLLSIGILAELLARYQLGKDFSIGAAAPQAIASTWLYRFENPIYDALALQLLAFGLWWPPLAIFGVTAQLFISAGGVRGERATIQEKFGRYNRGWESPMWDALVSGITLVERYLPPPR